VVALELVSLSENAVFRVDTEDGGRHALRLHRPGYNSRAEMDSELAWVEALRAAGVDTPLIRRDAGGNGFREVDIELEVEGEGEIGVEREVERGVRSEVAGETPRVGTETRLAGLIEWIDGVDLDHVLAPPAEPGRPTRQPTRQMVAETYRRIGVTLAVIRRHGQVWEPPPGFTRRRWDADGLVGPQPLWGRFWEIPADEDRRRLFRRAAEVLHRRLSNLPTDRAAFGLIHADLHTRNVLVAGDRLVIIDFDDAGFGWFIHEIAVALHPATDEPWFGDAREALIDGYRSMYPLTDIEVELLPAFLTIRSLMVVAWLDARPELGLSDHLPAVIDGAAADAERYLDSDP
ncbi:MAG: phosphotransferase, partial [Acidimicrobiales bacterium]